MKRLQVIVFLLSAFAVSGQNVNYTKGVYGHPKSFWDQGLTLPALGVNAVFLHHQSISTEFMTRAKKEGLKVYAEFASLNGKPYVETHPEAWAIDRHGNRVQAATWFMGVCPSEPGFRKYRLEELKKLISTYDIDGVWMDYLHWHAQFEDPEPVLPETCFCDHCLAGFRQYAKITLPDGPVSIKADYILTKEEAKWRSWRCQVIADWVKLFREVMDREKPGLLLGIYHCPWDDDDFGGARRKILGLDYTLLSKHADVFSPMVYHGRMGKDPEWVKENIEWFSKVIDGVRASDRKPLIWPIVQAYNDPAVISAEAFERVLRYGLSSGSSGVMMFTSDAVADDTTKTAVMRRVYSDFR